MHETVLAITGGTGTFGNAVLEQFLGTEIKEIRIFSRDEKKQDDMRRQYQSEKVRFYLGDVRDQRAVEDALTGVDYVFHAAALKQVPSCEFFPMEAVRTNTIGADNVLNAAIYKGVRNGIVLSTDKAVYPINAMGISKAMMEKVAIAKARVAPERTTICCTRYGNVMASRGSVVPLFIRLIQTGKSLTLTDPSMTRFMMDINGAVELVLFAFDHGRPGDIFVQKAPAATIDTLAQAMKKVFGAANPVQIIGTRHGEKLFETLLTREEMAVAEDMGDYFRVPADRRDLNYELYFERGESRLSAQDDYNSHNTRRLDVDEMADMLRSLDIVKRALGGEMINE